MTLMNRSTSQYFGPKRKSRVVGGTDRLGRDSRSANMPWRARALKALSAGYDTRRVFRRMKSIRMNWPRVIVFVK